MRNIHSAASLLVKLNQSDSPLFKYKKQYLFLPLIQDRAFERFVNEYKFIKPIY